MALATLTKTPYDDLGPTMSETLREELSELNNRVHDLEKYAAVTNEKLSTFQKSLDNLTAALFKALWIFGGSMLAAMATWIINGGLTTISG